MAAEDARMLRTALLLHRFTLQELCSRADVNRNTASSWLKRNVSALEVVRPSRTLAGRGRPAKTWRLRVAGIGAVQQQLAQLDVRDDSLVRIPESYITPVAKLTERYRCAQAADDTVEAAQLRRAAQLRIRLAWETCVRMDALGYEIADEPMRVLAESERDLGIATIWGESTLPEVAVWVAEKLHDLARQGVSRRFAGRILRLRTEVRDPVQSIRLTAASFAAQVWADEELDPRFGIPTDSLRACSAALTNVPMRQRIEELSVVLNPTHNMTYRTDSEQREAILLGLATMHRNRPSETVDD